MEKRGMMLAEETLKIIVAIIGITFLVILLTSLYFSNVEDKKLQQAKQELITGDNSLKALIDLLSEGQEKTKTLLSPVGWSLYSFSGEKPNSCLGENCICICDNPTFKKEAQECSESGACLDVENVVPFNPIKIKSPSEGVVNLSIKKDNGRVFFTTYSENKGSESGQSGAQSPTGNPGTELVPEEVEVATKFSVSPIGWLKEKARNLWGKIYRPSYDQSTPTAVLGVKANYNPDTQGIAVNNTGSGMA